MSDNNTANANTLFALFPSLYEKYKNFWEEEIKKYERMLGVAEGKAASATATAEEARKEKIPSCPPGYESYVHEICEERRKKIDYAGEANLHLAYVRGGLNAAKEHLAALDLPPTRKELKSLVDMSYSEGRGRDGRNIIHEQYKDMLVVFLQGLGIPAEIYKEYPGIRIREGFAPDNDPNPSWGDVYAVEYAPQIICPIEWFKKAGGKGGELKGVIILEPPPPPSPLQEKDGLKFRQMERHRVFLYV